LASIGSRWKCLRPGKRKSRSCTNSKARPRSDPRPGFLLPAILGACLSCHGLRQVAVYFGEPWSQLSCYSPGEDPFHHTPPRDQEGISKVRESGFILVAAAVSSVLLYQSSFAQSSPSNDRITGGQAIPIKQEPNIARLATKPAQTKGAIGTRRSRHRAFLAPRQK
jgi:hypothetical protein